MTDTELIKSKIDIIEFISEYVALKKSGRNFKALCPFHGEKTPSFYVSPERQAWYCFGACSSGGDVISFLQKWEKIEFIEALKILAKRVGVTLSHFAPSEESKKKEKLYEINHLASEFYHFLLTSHKLGGKAQEYLKGRGIKRQIIETFTLGYAPASWDSLFRFLIKKGYEKEDIFTAGLLVKSEEGTFYDRFRGRLMFTLRDHRGNIIGFSGRKLPPEEEKEAKYINSPETPLYIKGSTLYGLDVTREAIKKEGKVVVVEGEFDMLASFQSGITNVVAIKGSALTEDQALLLRRYTENVILGLDSDFAGNEAAKRGIEIAEKAGLVVKIAELTVGKDPAECIEKAPHLWKKAVETPVPIYDFIIEKAFSKYSKEGVVGKKKIGEETIPFLAKIGNPIIASHYIKSLAKKLEVTEESIEVVIRQFQKGKQLTPEAVAFMPPKPRGVLLEEYLLSLIIQGEDPVPSYLAVAKILEPSDFSQPAIRKILVEMALYFKIHKKFNRKKFSKFLSAEIMPTFDKILLLDIEHILSDENLYRRELKGSAYEIKKMALRRKINELSTEIRKKEGERDEEEIELLRKKLRQILEKIKEIDKIRE